MFGNELIEQSYLLGKPPVVSLEVGKRTVRKNYVFNLPWSEALRKETYASLVLSSQKKVCEKKEPPYFSRPVNYECLRSVELRKL